MRWLAFASLALGVSCRPSARGAPGASDAAGVAPADASRDAGSAEGRLPRWTRPIAAARWSSAIAVVGRERATGHLAFAKIDDARPEVALAVPLPVGLEDPELVGSARGFGLLG